MLHNMEIDFKLVYLANTPERVSHNRFFKYKIVLILTLHWSLATQSHSHSNHNLDKLQLWLHSLNYTT